MFDRLYDLPDAGIIAVFIATTVSLLWLVAFIVRRTPRLHMAPTDGEFYVRTQGTLFAVCCFVLAFTLVQAQTNYRHADQIVTEEASRIGAIDRILVRATDLAGGDARQRLLDYARAVVDEEWPAMRRGAESEAVERRFGDLTQALLGISSAPGRQSMIFAELVKLADELAEHRDLRLEITHLRLPGTFWAVACLAIGVLIGMAGALAQTRPRLVVMTGSVAIIGGLAAIVFIHDQPFKGETSVKADPIMRVIAQMDRRGN